MLSALSRSSFGKKSAKGFRGEGYLLANLYGKGIDNRHLVFEYNSFFKAVKHKSSLVFSVKIDSKEIMPVVVQAVSYTHLTLPTKA